MRRDFLLGLTLEQLHELRWTLYWECGRMVNKLWFDWAIKEGIIKIMFEMLGDSDRFNRWDVEQEIQRRSQKLRSPFIIKAK